MVRSFTATKMKQVLKCFSDFLFTHLEKMIMLPGCICGHYWLWHCIRIC